VARSGQLIRLLIPIGRTLRAHGLGRESSAVKNVQL
jgi:hypothetical protein